jgi:hypothetical protein
VKNVVTVVICGITLAATTVAAAGPPIALPALTAKAQRLSGIAAKPRIRVVYKSAAGMRAQATRLLDRDYPPDQQAYDETLYRALGLLDASAALRPILLRETTNVLGLYDPVTRTLYVRKGRTVKRALVHELVHALQDKAFNLRRLSNLRRGSRDAAAAAAAAVEGDATFATQLGGRVLTVAHSRTGPSSPIGSFLELEHEFPYTTGLQFIATLHNLGGNRAVFTALRTFPQTTKQVFHVDAFLGREAPVAIDVPDAVGAFTLARTDTFGELDVRALLATFHVPGLDRAADGWTGGRTAVFRDAGGRDVAAVGLTWETPADTAQWAEAVTVYVNEAFDAASPGFPATVSCAASACWSVDGRSIAFVRDGSRSALAFGPTVDDAAAVARAVVR